MMAPVDQSTRRARRTRQSTGPTMPPRQPRMLVLALATVLLACSTCSTAEARALSRALSAAPQTPPPPPVVLTFGELKPVLSSVWVPSVAASQPRVQVPVQGTSPPSTPDTMSRVSYTVSYTRRPAYLITGQVVVTSAAFSSVDSGDAQPSYTLQPPTITLMQQGAEQPQAVPPGAVKCSALTLAPGSASTCSFSARVFAFLQAPAPGSAQATIKLTGGGFQSAEPAVISTPPQAFSFPAGSAAGGGGGGSGGGGAATPSQLLQDTMQSSGGGGAAAVATITNYFEPGEGRIIPHGVQGKQPAANSVLTDTACFTYSALIPDIPREQCGKPLQVVNSATVEGTSDGLQRAASDVSSVTIELLGCDDSQAAAAEASASGPAAVSTASVLLAEPEGTSTSKRLTAASQAAVDAAPIVAPPGVVVAPAGSKLCGPVALCTPLQACLDNLVCCERGSMRCGNTCAPRGSSCVDGRVLAAGVATAAVASSSGVFASGQGCLDGRCGGAYNGYAIQCGAVVCGGGAVCQAGVCVPPGGSICGTTVCNVAGQVCVAGVCCHAAEAVCGATCCPQGTQCLNGACVPAGSTLCGGAVCAAAGHTCVRGIGCCPVGHDYCAGGCCGGNSVCSSDGRCIPVGSQVCGAAVCLQGQTCIGTTCCSVGETGCGGTTCCSQGATCLQMAAGPMCAPMGSQACGPTAICSFAANQYCADPYRGLCCPQGRRGCYGQCCEFGMVCSMQMQQCVPGSSAAIAAESELARPWGTDGVLAPVNIHHHHHHNEGSPQPQGRRHRHMRHLHAHAHGPGHEL